jgi:uncharacterized membrane protein
MRKRSRRRRSRREVWRDSRAWSDPRSVTKIIWLYIQSREMNLGWRCNESRQHHPFTDLSWANSTSNGNIKDLRRLLPSISLVTLVSLSLVFLFFRSGQLKMKVLKWRNDSRNISKSREILCACPVLSTVQYSTVLYVCTCTVITYIAVLYCTYSTVHVPYYIIHILPCTKYIQLSWNVESMIRKDEAMNSLKGSDRRW